MKLLIVTGPYEADRIRRAAVSAGIEAVAVEPGESLSGWITATRPEVIVLAPQVISADPATALAKVRAVPRGRVPILVVGDADEEEALRPLADGFFVRPIAADDLIEQARVAMAEAAARPQEEGGSGPHVSDSGRVVEPTSDSAARSGKSPVLKPLMATPESAEGERSVLTREVPRGALADAVGSDGEAATRASGPVRPQRPPSTFDRLTETIDADIDADLEAELQDVVRAVGGLRQANRVSHAAVAVPETLDAVPPEPAVEALSELSDESSQKTREVLQQIGPGGEQPASAPRAPLALRAGGERDEATDRATVQARYALVEDGDYFQILGVPRDTDADVIQRAGETLLSRLATPALNPVVATELAEQLKEIRVVVSEAVRLLADDRLRAQYRAHLPAQSADAAGASV